MIKPLFRRAKEWPLISAPRFARERQRRPSVPAVGQRRLQSNVEGDLAQVVLVLSSSYFGEWGEEEAEQQAALLAFYATLLAKLPDACEVVAIVEKNDPTEATAFALAQRTSGPLKILPIDLSPSAFVRDPFCTVLIAGQPRLVEPDVFMKGRPVDDDLPELLAPGLGLPFEVGDDTFAGGNILAGVDHLFVGADTASGVAHQPNESDEDAAARELAELETIGTRKVIVVGTEELVPNETQPEGTNHRYHIGNLDSRQPIFHIDMFMTLAVKDGRDVVVLGRPSLARAKLPDAWPLEAELDAELGEIAVKIRAQGIEVLEIPMPLFGVEEGGIISFFYAPYPNALVETGTSRRVWLPQFEMLWPEVVGIDKDVADIWRDVLGYEVIRVPGCTLLASSPGGLHCATHDTLRKSLPSNS